MHQTDLILPTYFCLLASALLITTSPDASGVSAASLCQGFAECHTASVEALYTVPLTNSIASRNSVSQYCPILDHYSLFNGWRDCPAVWGAFDHASPSEVAYNAEILLEAARQGNAPLMAILLNAGVSPMGVNELGFRDCPAMFAAAETGCVECMRLLVEAGVDPDMIEPQQLYADVSHCTTPLKKAAIAGHAEAVLWLLDTGRVDASREDDYLRLTPLGWAARNGDLATVKVLMEHPVHGELVKSGSVWNGSTLVDNMALNQAAKSQRDGWDKVKYLLETMSFPLKDSDGVWKGDLLTAERTDAIQTAFEYAAYNARHHTMEALLEYLIRPGEATFAALDIDAIEWGLSVAAKGNEAEAFKLLTKLALHMKYPNEEEAEEGKDILDSLLQDCLIEASFSNSVDIARYLVEEHGLDVNAQSTWWLSPLQYAADGGVEMARYLLEETDADIHRGYGPVFGHDGTPLWRAVHAKHAGIVRLLLEHGGPVSSVTPEGVPNFKSGKAAVILTADPHYDLDDNKDVHLRWGDAESLGEELGITMDSHGKGPGYGQVRLKLKEGDEAWWDQLQHRRDFHPMSGLRPPWEQLNIAAQ